MNFKFSLISDMHVDHPQPKTPYDDLLANVIVAGDTSNGLLGTKFLSKLQRKGFDVFAVPGNHEHYGNLNQARTPEQTNTQFYNLLNQKQIVFPQDGLMIVGTNGWYRVSDEALWTGYMNDSLYSTITASQMNQLAVLEADYIKRALCYHDDRKAIVVTHTAPCLDTLNPHYDGHYSNEWYWNPHMLEVLRRHSDQILVWCHGHTHAPSDKIVDGVRVVCNPRGYPGENPKWSPMTIEVEL